MRVNRWTKLAPLDDPGVSPDAIDPADLLTLADVAEQTGLSYWLVREGARALKLGRHFGKWIYLSRSDVARLRAAHLRGVR